MEHSDKFNVGHIRTKDETEARNLANLLPEQERAARVNIVPKLNALYQWQGKIEFRPESLIIIKTKSALLDDIIELVKANHSHQLPEVTAMPIDGASADYLAWLQDELGNG